MVGLELRGKARLEAQHVNIIWEAIEALGIAFSGY